MSALSSAPAAPRYPLLLRALLRATWPNSRQAIVTKWLVLSFVPLYGYFFWGRVYLSDWWIFVRGTLLLALLGTLCMLAASYLAVSTAQRYPEPNQVLRRVGLHMGGLLVISVVAMSSIMWSFNTMHLFGYHYNPAIAPWLVLSSFVVAGVLATLTEVTFALGQWQTNQLGTEELAREQLQHQLLELKQQVNPHFLFNSLNSLSILISEDPTQAERFVDELAQVYRYQLQATRSSQLPALAGLVPLEAELRFLHSYTYLLGVRYGAGIAFSLPASSAYAPGALFPLTLQALVDNAIRHNALSVSRPLRIGVEVGADCVRVHNSLHKRSVRLPLMRERLRDLQARYQQLGPDHAVQVEASADCFSVRVPLSSEATA